MEGINLVSVLSAKSLRVAILKARLYISCVKKGDWKGGYKCKIYNLSLRNF